jgi:alpha-glucosidase
MPPRWALGYHQCRYSYNPEARVREIAQEFRDRDIPCDVIWLDIDYMDEYRVFTFDKRQFPDPRRLNSDLQAQGFRTIWMIDPGIKAEPGFSVYDSGTAGDHWVKTARGEVYKGEVWPGQCVFPDYTRAETRQWWAGLYKDFLATGIDGVWNDMNEPAIFNVASKTMPEDNVHRGGEGLAVGPHSRFHNVYGMLMARATREGVMAVNPDRRPFVLTRAGYLGSQRYAATWTGDNSAGWDDLEASIPMILNLGLSGQPLCGPDIGGFNGNGDGAMFARWMGIGALFPFARGHTGKGNINKEPWAFDAAVEKTCRLALQRRYRLMPYLYALFHEAWTTGMPVMRPVFFADPKDPALRSEDDVFLLGGDVLVVPKVTPMRDRVPSLPRGVWTRFDVVDGQDPDLPDLLLRAGAIIPAGPVMEFTGEKPLDPLTLYVCLDENGRAEGLLYEDAGDGWGYEKGEFLVTRYVAQRENGGVRVSIAGEEGKMARSARKLVACLLNPDGSSTTAEGQDGSPVLVPQPR